MKGIGRDALRSIATVMQKREGTRRATHQRLWWMEFARGIITCAAGLLFLTASFFAPHLFIYSLGVYLVIDGLLDLYGVRTSRGASQREPLAYAGGAASLLSGLFSLVLPTLALLLFAALIAVRLLLMSFSQMRTARRTRGRSIALLWAYSGFLALLGLFLLLFPLLAMTLMVVFLGSYMVIAGLVLLRRGLALRFTSSSPSPALPLLLQASPGLGEGLPPSTRRAVIFVRRSAAEGLGHIAWGFEWTNGWFNVGAVENLHQKLFAKPADMDFWSTHTLDPMTTIQQWAYPYDEYKLFFVPEPRPKAAWNTVIWESRQPYSFVHHNCCDMAYEILCAYGCRELLDPAKEFVPNDWYDALPGLSFLLAAVIFVASGNSLLVILLAQSQHAQPAVIGLIFTLAGLGSILGSLVALPIQRRFRFGHITISGCWGFVLCWLLYPVAHVPLAVGAVCAGLSFISVILDVALVSYRLALIPDELRGRVSSITNLLLLGSRSLGLAVTGLLLQQLGTFPTIVFFWGCLFMAAVGTTLSTALRRASSLTTTRFHSVPDDKS